jgi:soluble lytic murein transglycosylase
MTRIRILLIAAVLGVAAALIATRLVDVEEALREVTLPLRHDDVIRQQAAEKDLDPALIAAVIYAESRFVEGQTSEAGAIGLMQVTPATAEAIATKSGGTAFEVSDLDNADINIRYGSFHLRELLDQYDGSLIAALAAYNAGSGRVDDWGGASLGLEDIRFEDTRAYVEQVLDKADEYRENYADDLGL